MCNGAARGDHPWLRSSTSTAAATFSGGAEFSAKDLRADGRWDDKLCRQVKSTVAVFELLMGVKPFASRTQEDLASFKRKLRLVPKRYDMMSEKSRQIVLSAAEGRPTGLPQAELGLAPPTINRHITALRVIHRWARTAGVAAPTWSFENLHIGVSKKKRDRNQRPATSTDDLQRLFALPIFTGRQPHRGGTGQVVLRARFTPGPAIVHDAFYWVPLLTYYDGARREENCKLRPDDFRVLDGIHYIQIDHTETSTALKDQRVESEFRADLLGHVGKTITEERYSDPADLKPLQEMVNQLPSMTGHLVVGPSRQHIAKSRLKPLL